MAPKMRSDEEGKNYGRGDEEIKRRNENKKKEKYYYEEDAHVFNDKFKTNKKMTCKYVSFMLFTNVHMIDSVDGVNYDQPPCENLNRI